MTKDSKFIEENLLIILSEMKAQPYVANALPPNMMSYSEQLKQVEEFIRSAGEYDIAYENLIALMEIAPVSLSGRASIKLLEVGLLFGFKTEREVDADFDRRHIQ
jgi:hypothetical protein